MANTIARAYGYDSTRTKEAHRLGSMQSAAHADTWRTFTTATVYADGSGYVSVERDGTIIHRFDFDAEGGN